jgi:hypothetical protein
VTVANRNSPGQILDSGNSRFHGGAIAGDDDLAGRVAIGHGHAAVGLTESQQLRDAIVGETDNRGHCPRPTLAGCLHLLATFSDESNRVAQRDDSRGNHGRVLAQRMAGDVDRFRSGDAGGGPALAQSGEEGDRDGHDRRLGIDRQVQLLGRAVECKPAYRFVEGLVGFRKHGGCCGRGLDQSLSHSHRLGTLTGENEGYSIHVLLTVSLGSYARVGRLAEPGL